MTAVPLDDGIAPATAVEALDPASTETSRIAAMDAIRGFAVIGILLRNIYVFGMPTAAFSIPALWGGGNLLDLYSWAFVMISVDGTMRALFSLLFGASAMVMLSRVDTQGIGAVDYFYRRLIWLMVFGLIHAYLLLSYVDILFLYGLLGLLIFPLRNLKPRTLLVAAFLGTFVAAIWGTLGVLVTIVQSDWQTSANIAPEIVLASTVEIPFSSGDTGAQTGADEKVEALEREIAEDIWDRRQDYSYNIVSLYESAFWNQTGEVIETHIYDIGALFLIGIAFFKLGIVTGARSTGFYLAMALLGYGWGLAINFANTYADLPIVEILGEPPKWITLIYDFGRIGVACGHLALVVLLMRLRFMSALKNLLIAAGRMALTNYLLQTIVCTTLFFGHGFALFGVFTHSELLGIALLIGAAQLVASRIYLIFFRQGPAEWLIRRLIRWNGRAPGNAVAAA